MASRFIVNDNATWGSGYTVTDTTTGSSTNLQYNYTGTANSTTATTWDFAPLCEQQEVEPANAEEFRLRLHQDDQFVENQLRWNGRLEQFHTRGNGSTGQWTDSGSLQCYTTTGTDTAGSWWITSDVGYWHNKEHTLLNRFMYQAFVVTPHRLGINTLPITKPLRKFTKWLIPNKSGEEIQKEWAEKNSMKLLKDWLDPHEFNELMKRGELEIFAEDVVYIVKKNPHAEIIRKKDGKEDKFCIIPTKMGWATGDILLSKILMLKTDPAEMERVAIKRS